MPSAKTWYIKPDGTGDAPTIQAGIDSAGVGDTVLVACGTYYEHDIVIKSGMHLTSEMELAECVTIDAQQQGRVFYCDHVDDTGIVGFTVTGGLGDHGGGMYCGYSSPRLAYCVFSGNSATIVGGGLRCMDYSSPLIANCTFTDNSAQNGGGGIGCFNHSSPTLLSCTFANNVAISFDGGGMSCWVDCSPTLDACTFSGNLAGRSGGGMDLWTSRADLSGCTFAGNAAAYAGGGMHCINTSSPSIVNCTFTDNSAGGGGGGLYCRYGSSPVLENTIITFSTQGEAISCFDDLSDPILVCSNAYGNAGGDWVGCVAGQNGINGNFSADPLFCDPANGDFTLDVASPCLPGNHPYGEDCGLIGALSQGCGMLTVFLDIKPRSCPNPLNVKSFDTPARNGKPKKGGVLPVAILGTGEFDVTDIDVSTLLLEGVAPIRLSLEDVATPVSGGELNDGTNLDPRSSKDFATSGANNGDCECTTAGPDGYMDLTLKFQKSEIVTALGSVVTGDVIPLTLTGELLDGTPFESMDCVTIVGGHAEPPDFKESCEVVLKPATPNPFNPLTRISYVLPREDFVMLSIYDVAGRMVEQLVGEIQPAGNHVVEWDASRHPSGIYFYRLTAGNRTLTKKMVLIK